MSNAIFKVPSAVNEQILDYRLGSAERASVMAKISALKSAFRDVPMIINGVEIRTDQKATLAAPHEHGHILGHYSLCAEDHVKQAIDAALKAKESWCHMPWSERAAIFLRAADLITGPRRDYMNAVTMMAQSKNIYQSEIDAIAEFADFLRFNVQYVTQMYADQPDSSPTIWNQLEYRPLEGFVFALTPFNFTAIAGNLPAAPAMLGNTVIWKPADQQIYSAIAVMDIFKEAGLPDGVINLIYGDGPMIGKQIFEHREFAGLHFTGSTGVFKTLWRTIGENIDKYRGYPRIVGETGGKDFVVAHPSTDPDELVTALIRGAFEYQGQKCSAASRAYIPASLWKKIKSKLIAQIEELKIGSVEDFSNFVNAVIDKRAYQKIMKYINAAKKNKEAEIIVGGTASDKTGYFIRPTVILTENPFFTTMCEEIFGPVLTIYVYKDREFNKVLDLVDQTSPYGLTGSIMGRDREAIIAAKRKLYNAAGNLYINDKPTGAVVGQQPFGGGRASGTNDKAGSILNLYRWVSPRTIKENLLPPTHYGYPFLG